MAPNPPGTQAHQHTRNTGVTNQAMHTHLPSNRNPGDQCNTKHISPSKATSQAATRLHNMGGIIRADPRGGDTGPCSRKDGTSRHNTQDLPPLGIG
ncbi:Hypothetical predicted protein [Pelobates cultripes]|uniref:Uncharacterized protein n=1 Tax=Pelobates cultripes TaxID=61616 RepID=A0AAD1R7U4_PELCU|nr:Hypothetical predicted protein [Pelobates cultripes]